MKNYRNLTVFSMFLLLFLFSVSGSIAAPKNYPNLLDNDQTTTDYLDQPAVVNIHDPLEPMNRAFFQFNDKFYVWLLKPVTNAYMWVLPLEFRDSLNNFFLNLAMPVRLVNTLLQGNLEASGVVLERFLINTTLGVYGFADVADDEFDIGPRHADFGQTLGKWGLGEGIYFCWPILGPSSVRDTAGFVADSYASVIPYIDPNTSTLTITYYSTNMVNKVSLHPDAYDELKRYSLDPYIASRQAYYEYRKALIDRQ